MNETNKQLPAIDDIVNTLFNLMQVTVRVFAQLSQQADKILLFDTTHMNICSNSSGASLKDSKAITEGPTRVHPSYVSKPPSTKISCPTMYSQRRRNSTATTTSYTKNDDATPFAFFFFLLLSLLERYPSGEEESARQCLCAALLSHVLLQNQTMLVFLAKKLGKLTSRHFAINEARRDHVHPHASAAHLLRKRLRCSLRRNQLVDRAKESPGITYQCRLGSTVCDLARIAVSANHRADVDDAATTAS